MTKPAAAGDKEQNGNPGRFTPSRYQIVENVHNFLCGFNMLGVCRIFTQHTLMTMVANQ
jgi:hypothetical protein